MVIIIDLFCTPIGQQLLNKSQYSTLEQDLYKQHSTVEHDFYKLTTTIKLLCSNCHGQAIRRHGSYKQIMLGGAEGRVCLATYHFVERIILHFYCEMVTEH